MKEIRRPSLEVTLPMPDFVSLGIASPVTPALMLVESEPIFNPEAVKIWIEPYLRSLLMIVVSTIRFSIRS